MIELLAGMVIGVVIAWFAPIHLAQTFGYDFRVYPIEKYGLKIIIEREW